MTAQKHLDLRYGVFLIAWHYEGVGSVTHIEMITTRFRGFKADPLQFIDKLPSFTGLPFRHETPQPHPENQASFRSSQSCP